MKKLSLLLALLLVITVGGVYATWIYTDKTDVADLAPTVGINLTEATFAGTYGTYEVDTTSLALKVDPKPGTTFTTGLLISGDIIIKFKPQTYAPVEVKEEGVPTTFQFSLTNTSWQFDDGHGEGARDIITLAHPEKHNVTWSAPDQNGTLTYTISATELASHIGLTEFTLDTKVLYDQFATALGNGKIMITVSDGTHN